MNVQIILGQMLMLFAMMLIGYVIWKKNWLDESAYQRLSRIVVNIFNPVLVVYGVAGKSSAGNTGLLLQNIGLVALYFIILWVMSYVIPFIVRPTYGEKDLYRFMTMFANVGFMGIPVITGIYGNDAMIYIVFYMLAYNLLIYTYGINLAGKAGTIQRQERGMEIIGEKTTFSWKRMLNAGVIASVAAIVIFLFQIPLPDMVVGFCDYIGNATIPLSMLLIGASIAKVNLKAIFSTGRIYLFTLIRMVILPVIVTLLLKHILPVNEMIFGVFILQMSMPVGSIVALMAKENGADEACCTNGIVLTTLLSLVTIPLVCLFL